MIQALLVLVCLGWRHRGGAAANLKPGKNTWKNYSAYTLADHSLTTKDRADLLKALGIVRVQSAAELGRKSFRKLLHPSGRQNSAAPPEGTGREEEDSDLALKLPGRTSPFTTASNHVRAMVPLPESLRFRPRVVSLNVMVAGLSGLGKTTTCASLIESWCGDALPIGSATKKKQSVLPHRKSTKVVDASRRFERYDPESNTILRVRIIDTPGFGNRVDHRNAVRPIARFVAKSRDRQYRAETSAEMPDVDVESTDALVHLCLYFLSPGRFLAIDRHFLRKMQREVAVVPVIAKADTLTDQEIAHYRAELRRIFERDRIDVYDFDSDAPAKGIETRSNGSFNGFNRRRRVGEALAIVSRDGLYPWGQSRSYDPDHSDLGLVRDLLLSEHTERFVELAREKYGAYRARRIFWRRLSDVARYALLGLLFLKTVGLSGSGESWDVAASRLLQNIATSVLALVDSITTRFGGSPEASEVVPPPVQAEPPARRSFFGKRQTPEPLSTLTESAASVASHSESESPEAGQGRTLFDLLIGRANWTELEVPASGPAEGIVAPISPSASRRGLFGR